MTGAWAVVLGIVALLGVNVLIPRFQLELPESDSVFIRSIAFTLVNTGWVPIENLHFSMVQCSTVLSRLDLPDSAPTPAHWREKPCVLDGERAKPRDFPRTSRRLEPDERFSIRLSEMLPDTKVDYVHGVVLVQYQPWLVPIQFVKQFPVQAQRSHDGRLNWYSKPIRDE